MGSGGGDNDDGGSGGGGGGGAATAAAGGHRGATEKPDTANVFPDPSDARATSAFAKKVILDVRRRMRKTDLVAMRRNAAVTNHE